MHILHLWQRLHLHNSRIHRRQAPQLFELLRALTGYTLRDLVYLLTIHMLITTTSNGEVTAVESVVLPICQQHPLESIQNYTMCF